MENKMYEFSIVLSEVQMLTAIAVIIAVTSGICSVLKINGGKFMGVPHKLIVACLVTVYVYVGFIFEKHVMMQYINTLMLMFFGATGIFTGLKSINVNKIEIVEEDDE
jgi:hypothetical protein